MLKIDGKYNSAIAYARTLEKSAMGQLKALCDLPFTEGAKLRVMPDAHAGAGCVVGTTMTVTDKIVPNLVGVDIACGMETVNIGKVRVDFRKLDNVIREHVPSGFALREKPHRFAEEWEFGRLRCAKILQPDKTLKALGSLGGGNHFIEVSEDAESGERYLIVHSGSRNPGLQVANYYQNKAGEARKEGLAWELAYVSGSDFEDYVHDMKIMQSFANLSRRAMVDEILKGMKWKARDSFTTMHNYLDVENMILRKGAVSAQKGERLLIPMNMRDGSLLCEGLGNPEWNYSAPHGAGRIYSRKEARENLTLTRFREEMAGIYSTSINKDTIDESPGAYKPMAEIMEQIGETVKIKAILKPIYNFKAG